jgi:hypothetical protein
MKALALVIQWVARVLSLLSIGVILLFIVGEGFDPTRVALKEWAGLLFFPFGVVVGLVMGWRWDGIGAAIALGSLLAFYGVQLAMWGRLPRGPYFALFTSPAILFGASWLLQRATDRSLSPRAS